GGGSSAIRATHKQIITAPLRSCRRCFKIHQDTSRGKQLILPILMISLFQHPRKGLTTYNDCCTNKLRGGNPGVVKVAFNSCEIRLWFCRCSIVRRQRTSR